MKKKYFFALCLVACLGFIMISCSSDESDATEKVSVQQPNADGLFHYQLELNCEAPGFDDGEGSTRAMSYNWENNATLYIRFKNGSSYVDGKATYNASSSKWSIETTSTLPVVTSETACEVYYFQDPQSADASTVTLSEHTACFYTTSAIYTNPSSSASSVSITATLGKKMWRMRFKGNSGTTFTLPASGNDINYCTSYNRSTGVLTSNKKDVTLTVETDGYTPYIYGQFQSTSGDNTMTITHSNMTFTRTITGSSIAAGESAYLAVPTESSHDGWDIPDPVPVDPNATINVQDFVAFTDGWVTDWTFGGTATTFDYATFRKDYAESLSDDYIAGLIYSDEPYTVTEYGNYLFKSTGEQYTPGTEYYLCAVAKNESGRRGPLLRYLFRTVSDSAPCAEISNINAATSTKWTYDITMKNNATCYYLCSSTTEQDYNDNWHWFAYKIHYWATSNQISTYNWESIADVLTSGTCSMITIGTWGVDASGNIGNAKVAYGSTSSSAPANTPAKNTQKREVMSKAKLQQMYENTKIVKLQ